MSTARSILGSSFVAWLVGAVVGVYYLFTFIGFTPQLRPDRLKFGIDLVGGTYITLEVQVDKAVEAELFDKAETIGKKLKEAKAELPASQKIEQNRAILKFSSSAAANNALNLVGNSLPELKILVENSELIMSFKDAALKRIREWAVLGNIEVLRTRLDKLGVGEVSIAAQGEKNIVIELPNVDNPQQAKAMIGKAALLEIKLIERVAGSEQELLDEYDGEIPDDMMIVPGKARGSYGRPYYLVPKHTDLTGRLLKDSYVGFGGQNQTEVVVHFKFNADGGEKFYELTRKNFNRQIAMIVDNEVISDPRVSTPIGAEGYIHGDFNKESATELATLLKSGAFVAPVTFEEERKIGPSLGQEAIYQGLMSCFVGLILLLVFSVVMYKVAGFFAFLALLYNLLIIMLALSWLGATLTLPGIAGMVLTVGMAIDASILIYEKIREELFSGTPWKKALDEGFSEAMSVILDSNITTFLVGVVLYKFGTGPIQGFAVTMMIGIIATLITGLFFLKSIFNFVLHTMRVQNIKI